MRRFGLKDESDWFLKQLMDVVVQGKSLSQLRTEAGWHWPNVLLALLDVADGWQTFGDFGAAKPFLTRPDIRSLTTPRWERINR